MKAATGVATHQDVLTGVNDVDGADGSQAVDVRKRVQEFSSILEDFDLPRPRHAAHHEAMLLLGVPYCSEPGQPAARVVIVASEKEPGRKRERETSLLLNTALESLIISAILASTQPPAS